jgi:uncharacterized protein YndB with AHSA1/START domain
MPDTSADRVIRGEVVVDAPVAEVWKVWTTEEGIKSFFAPECNIELRVDGPFEMFFLLDEEPGRRGGEGVRFLAVQPEKMLSFTWNAPPHLPDARSQWTHVVLRFFEADGGRTRLTLAHDGWGQGGEWDEAYAYFERAWLELVLPNLVKRFA